MVIISNFTKTMADIVNDELYTPTENTLISRDLLGVSVANARTYVKDVLNLDIFPPDECLKCEQVQVQKHELKVSLEISRSQLSKVEDQNQQLKSELGRLQNLFKDEQEKIKDLTGKLDIVHREKYSLEERLQKIIRRRNEKRQMKAANKNPICLNETVSTSFRSCSYHGLNVKKYRDDGKLACTCGVGFLSLELIQEHLLCIKSTYNEKFRCSVCKKRFGIWKYFINHLNKKHDLSFK